MNKDLKRQLYDELHKQIGDEIGVSAWAVNTYRSYILGHKISEKDILLAMEKSIINKERMIRELLGYISRCHEVEKIINEFSLDTKKSIIDRDIESQNKDIQA